MKTLCEEASICTWCNGSGEGVHPDTTCPYCNGSGVEPVIGTDDDRGVREVTK